jgi:uncharacterized membrane protein
MAAFAETGALIVFPILLEVQVTAHLLTTPVLWVVDYNTTTISDYLSIRGIICVVVDPFLFLILEILAICLLYRPESTMRTRRRWHRKTLPASFSY